MAHVHNGLHHYTKLLDAAARAIGEKAGAQDFTGIERFGETLTPVINLWELPEWALLRGEIIFSRQVDVGAAPALFSSIELVNPSTTTVLVTVLEIWSGGAATVQTNIDSGAALGALGTQRGVANDCRFPQLGAVSRATVVQGTLAAGVALPQDAITNNTRSTRPYIIQPGKKLAIINPTANSAISIGLLWTERELLPTEDRV